MQRIRTEIEIDAPTDQVWSVLADFSSYPAWSSFIREIDGRPSAGCRLRVRLEPPEGRGMTFRPRLTAVEPERQLRWRGRLGVPGLFDGEHCFRLIPTGQGRTRLVHSETFKGVLVPVLGRGLDSTRDGFEAFNTALKDRAERASAEQPAR